MTIVQKLAVKQLLMNKKRTLITLVGVIISVSMITAVLTLGVSFMDLMQRQVISNEGEWHFWYGDINETQLEEIERDQNQATILISQEEGFAEFEGSTNPDRPYLFIRNYNQEAFDHFPIELKEGRLPTQPNELVISDSISNQDAFSYQVGDSIELDIGQRERVGSDGTTESELSQSIPFIESDDVNEELIIEKTEVYTIVGEIETPFFENSRNPGYTFLSYTDESLITGDQETNAYVIMANLNRSSLEYIDGFAEEHGIQTVDNNNSLLRFSGVIASDRIFSMLLTLSAVIVSVIVVGSISLIYNAFAISVSSRARELGMLASVGATKRQKRNIVFFEGALIGVISIPLGLILGYGGTALSFILFNSLISQAIRATETLRVVFSPWTILITLIVSVSTLFLSTYIPAKKASEVTAIEAIRQTDTVKVSNKEVATSKFVKKIFGIEGDLALKNIKRNKSGYRAIIFSLSISLVLFLTVSYFATSLRKSNQLLEQGITHDMVVTLEQQVDSVSDQAFLSQLTTTENSDEAVILSQISTTAWIDEDKIAEELVGSGLIENGKYPYGVDLYGLDAKAMENYASSIEIEYDSQSSPTGNSMVIVQDTLRYITPDEDQTIVETEALNAEIGDSLALELYDYDSDSTVPIEPLEIRALVDEIPIGVPADIQLGMLNVFVSQEIFDSLLENMGLPEDSVNQNIYYKSEDANALETELEDIRTEADTASFSIYNSQRERQRGDQLILLGQVFSNAFVLLITLICVATIFNTISTSISLRKREFAMLKSVGMTTKSFIKMIRLESLFYGVKALLYGIPVSFLMILIIYQAWRTKFSFGFELPWMALLLAIISVFLIVGLAMMYATQKVKKDTIIEGLKQENI